jgi:hypothetical protein
LFRSALEEIGKTNIPYDYTLVTGDFISHNFKSHFHQFTGGDDEAYRSFVLKTMVFVSRSIKKALGTKPVYFCLGNNDSDYDDYAGVESGSGFLTELSKEWGIDGDPKAASDFAQGGYYAVPHPTLAGHELVVLNDVFWSYKYDPFWLFKSGSKFGPDGPQEKAELKWLHNTLQEAREKHERVILMTHMPPGIHSRNASYHAGRKKPQKTFYEQQYLEPFLNLLASYRDLIDGEFTGHTHLDDFRVAEDNDGKPAFYTHITPAVSPVNGNNPAFQVMLYDHTDGEVEDMATYYLSNLHVAGLKPAEWKLEYTFRAAYGYDGYNGKNLLALVQAIDSDPAVRRKFIDFCGVQGGGNPPPNMDNWKFFNCAHIFLFSSSYGDCYR